MFLLFGVEGVGKSSLLDQLSTHRLSEFGSQWIDFSQPCESADGDMVARIEEITEAAGEGDIIVIDHFEQGSNRAQHQIFKSWSTDGRDKNLNMIIAVSSDSFNAFRQLAQQYQIEVRSFQLMPCSLEEAEAYLQFSIFPEQPFGDLNIPRPIKNRIRDANGIYGRLNEIVLHDASSLTIKPELAPSALTKTRFSIGLLTLILLSITLVYWQSISELPVETPATKLALPGNLDNETKIEPQVTPEIQQEAVIPEAEVIEETGTRKVSLEDTVNNPLNNWFETKLETSLSWISESDQQRGTIQVMSIGIDRFEQNAFRKYINQLASNEVDVNQIRVFQTMAGEKIVYSIVYSEYISRREAGRQIKNIPEALRANSPIPRTIGSIALEIERFQASAAEN